MLLSAIEIARLVGRSERTIRNWLASGELKADKLHGVWRIEKDVALRVAKDMAERARATPAPLQRATEGLDEIVRPLLARVERLEAKIVALEVSLTALRVQKSAESHVARYDDRQTALDVAGVSAYPSGGQGGSTGFSARSFAREGSYTSGGGLPAGLVAWRSFVREHGISHTTALYRIERGEIPVVTGNWQMGRATITQAFDATGRREFWRAYHGHPQFVECPRCPHTVPTMPVSEDALAGVPIAALAEFEEDAGDAGDGEE